MVAKATIHVLRLQPNMRPQPFPRSGMTLK